MTSNEYAFDVNKELLREFAHELVTNNYMVHEDLEQWKGKEGSLNEITRFLSELQRRHATNSLSMNDQIFPYLAFYLTACELFSSFFPIETLTKIWETLSEEQRTALKLENPDFHYLSPTIKTLRAFNEGHYRSLFTFIDIGLRNAIAHANWTWDEENVVYYTKNDNPPEHIPYFELGQKNVAALVFLVMLIFELKEASNST